MPVCACHGANPNTREIGHRSLLYFVLQVELWSAGRVREAVPRSHAQRGWTLPPGPCDIMIDLFIIPVFLIALALHTCAYVLHTLPVRAPFLHFNC